MPELPEVETVRRGLAPAMLGARIEHVTTNRPDLRFPLPDAFADRLTGARIDAMDRRGKYLLCSLSTGETLIMHLGMSGRFTVRPRKTEQNTPSDTGEIAPDKDATPGVFHHGRDTNPAHDHIVFDMSPLEIADARSAASDTAGARIVYNDPRRFGFMDLAPTDALDDCRHFRAMGPEPLSNQFSAETFSQSLKGRATPIKTALLDQGVVAGIGNIYACEALFRAGISPRRKAASVSGVRAHRLYRALRDVLTEAIDAGGSSLRDFANADGDLGYFQKEFAVYDREGAPCRTCARPVTRFIQSGRSTFYCGACQK
ncbi:MAG: bifunctional DNA-formamidopyrimidine glycosylase/DNA-(apurinic or apyrimidinic site) lyase [Pseudomonadota bacterium]